MAVGLVEIPGAVGLAWECPNCSKMYPQHDVEKDEKQEMPSKCRRCGCPMDFKAQREFSDAQARKEQQNWSGRVTVS